jgi:hypothetical protein
VQRGLITSQDRFLSDIEPLMPASPDPKKIDTSSKFHQPGRGQDSLCFSYAIKV